MFFPEFNLSLPVFRFQEGDGKIKNNIEMIGNKHSRNLIFSEVLRECYTASEEALVLHEVFCIISCLN